MWGAYARSVMSALIQAEDLSAFIDRIFDLWKSLRDEIVMTDM